MFGHISRELDMRHDKRERIVKISRDITIGVKFALLNIPMFQKNSQRARGSSLLCTESRRRRIRRVCLQTLLAASLT